MSLQELLHYLLLGGVTSAILGISSLLALGVAIERFIALWGIGDGAKGLAEGVARHLLRGDLAGARSTAERSSTRVADIFLAGFDRANKGGASAGLEGAVERERIALTTKLRTNLWILGTIGATAPFVGLFGTVAGIMRSFRDLGIDVQAGGTGGSAAVMTGISEALVTTAVGILVAVEAVVLYNYFQARLGRLAIELKLLCEEFVELLREGLAREEPPAAVASSSGGTPAIASTEASPPPAAPATASS